MRDHLEAGETYRLGAPDLEYAELLPGKPGWVEQDEYEQRTRVGFNLERLVKSVDHLACTTGPWHPGADTGAHRYGPVTESVIEETDEFRTTRVDVEDGPEISRSYGVNPEQMSAW